MAILKTEGFLEKHVPGLYHFYERQVKNRFDDLFVFCFYAATGLAGLVAFLQLPTFLINQMGVVRVTIFGMFGLVGSLLCLIAVVIDVYWVERVGGLLLLTSVVMYGVMLLAANNGVPVALFFVCAMGILLIQRLVQIRH